MHANKKFAEDNHFDFPLLSDTDNAVAMLYGAAHKKKQPAARRIAILIDEHGKVSKIYDPAGTGEFPSTVLEDIKKDEL